MERAMRSLVGTLLCVLVVVLWPQAAASLPVFGGAGAHNIYFKDAEQHVNLDSDPAITVGDKFFGILNAQDIEKGGITLWSSDNVPAGGLDTVTGYFVSVVTAVSAPGAPGHTSGSGLSPTESHIDFGPVGIGGDPNGIFTPAELAAGAMMKIFADDTAVGGPGTPYKTSGPIGPGAGSDIANATDGIVLAVLGITPDGGYSYAHGPTSLAGGAVGEGWLGLRFLFKHPMLPAFASINDPLESEANQNVHFYAQTEIEVNPGAGPGSCGVWQLCTNDPAVVSVAEPAGLFSFGVLLVGLGFFSRRMLRRS